MEYKELVRVYEELEKTSKRLEKIEILANFLKKVKKEELKDLIYLAEGRIFPEWDERKIGFSSKLMIKALSLSGGESLNKVEELFRKKGDLGLVAEEIFKSRKQTTLSSKKLEIKKILENIRKLAELEGKGTVNKKINLISELLINSKADEAKYIVKTILENLRIGVSSGIIRESIARAFNIDVKEVEKVADLTGDYGEAGELAKSGESSNIKIKIGRPVKCMLALLAENIKEIFEDLGKEVQLENKIDGFRLQVHFDGREIKLFTRRMENVTGQFPDLIRVLKKSIKAKNCILDGEAVGYELKTKRYLPFQTVSQRIKRKYDIEEMAGKFPVELNIFDVLYYNNEELMEKNLRERRNILEKIIKEKKGEIRLTKKLVTKSEKEATNYFKSMLKGGYEGLVAKNLESKYRPGRYVKGWMKLKNILEPLDLVILGAEYGEGKRAGWLTSYTIGCKSGNKFLEIGKVSTGIKEKVSSKEGFTSKEELTYKEITKELEPLILERKGKEVKIKPKIIIEVGYEEIQESNKYESGFGLRFPRFLNIRRDKTLNEVSDLSLVKKIFRIQRGK